MNLLQTQGAFHSYLVKQVMTCSKSLFEAFAHQLQIPRSQCQDQFVDSKCHLDNNQPFFHELHAAKKLNYKLIMLKVNVF